MKKLKKFFSLALTITLIFGTTSSIVANEPGLPSGQIPLGQTTQTTGEIIVNGMEITAPRPSVTDGIIMLPLRSIAEQLGLELSWDETEKRVHIGPNYVLWIGQAKLSPDGGLTTREFGPPPEIIDGRTFVPISIFNHGFAGFSATIEGGKIIIDTVADVILPIAHSATIQYGHPGIIKNNNGPLLTYIRFPITHCFADGYISAWAHELHQHAENEIDTLRESDDSAAGELNINFNSYLVYGRFVGIVQQGFFNSTALAHPMDIIQTFNLDLDQEIFLGNSDIWDLSKAEDILLLLRYNILKVWSGTGELLDTDFLDNMDESWLEHIAIGPYGIYIILERGVHLPSYLGALNIMLPYDELDFALLLGKEVETLPESTGEQAIGQTIDPASDVVLESLPTPIMPPMSASRGDVDPSKPMIALTFDDGPSKYTPYILDLLERYGGRATFFVVGNLVEAKRDTVQRTVDLGNEVLGHSWDHRDLTKLSGSEIRTQLLNTNRVIEDITGTPTQFFRPPYGAVNDALKNVSRELGFGIINWSVDTLDWKNRNADVVYNAVMDNAANRAIVLTHDLHGTTADAMERVIPGLISRGYQLVTVSELLYYSGIAFEAGTVYRSGN